MKILIAEDDKNFGYILKDSLESDDHTVDLYVDGVRAVLKVIEDDYDFILLDIVMPRLNGIDALRIIKKLKPDMPVITFSGNAGAGEMANSLKAGALRCLTKPFEIAKLKEELEKHFNKEYSGH